MNIFSFIRCVILAGTVLSAETAAAATDPVITEFTSGLSFINAPVSITTGPDGNLWFTQVSPGSAQIGRITPLGVFSQISQGFSSGASPSSITAGPDGNLWFTDARGRIGRLTPAGIIAEFSSGLSVGSAPQSITAGPDGNLWFAQIGTTPSIGRINPMTLVITEFSHGLKPGSMPGSIAAGPDGNLWFTDSSGGIGRVTPSGDITEFSGVVSSTDITAGPDGNLWVTDPETNSIDRITTAGTITEFSFGLDSQSPQNICLGPDGNPWFTVGAGSIGRITPWGAIVEFSVPSLPGGAAAFPGHIIAGPDGALWFANAGGAVGRVTLPTDLVTVSVSGAGEVTSMSAGIACGNGNAVCSASFTEETKVTLMAAPAAGSTFAGWSGAGCSGVGTCTIALNTDTAVSASFVADSASDVILVSALLPTSRSVQVGAAATVFATVINASPDTAGTLCQLQPATTVPAGFFFQTTDPSTNALTGTANATVTLAPGAAQSFVLGLTPSASIAPTNIAFNFTCANAPAAVSSVGLNTLLLSASTTPTPDIVALSATANADGIVDIPGATGAGAFAIATVNVGAAGEITASTNIGAASLPVTVSICQTVPASGVCMAPPTASVSTMIAADTTPTFAVFVQGNGDVPFLPENNRVFLQFTDASGTVRGSTSVAVRTQ
jgi:virginiamycin B lyase